MEQVQALISGLGLPVAMLICVGWYFVRTQEQNTQRYDAMVADVKKDSKEREEKLYQALFENQALNKELCSKLDIKIDSISEKLDLMVKEG